MAGMTLLVLGGTIFLGRHIVEAALARGHRVVELAHACAAGTFNAVGPPMPMRALLESCTRAVATLTPEREADCLATLRA
jgi:NAD(P)-dependent dehydrogenase (short-subunit alcohol dehydrogenase family)